MKYITYVSDVTHELDVVTPNFNNISDLFKHLILPNYSTELIILSHHTIKQCGISIYDILSTIKSLCNQSTKPKIAIATDISISPTDLKELLGLDILGIYPVGLGFNQIETQFSLNELLSDKRHVHAKFKALLLYTKKKSLVRELPHLTNREEQIANLIKTTGDCNKTIARKLSISENTVKLHVSHILNKLGMQSRTQLAIQY